MELNILKIASDTSHNKILNNFTHRAYKKNPMCGDYIIFKIYMKKQIIEDISYETKSCIYCQASASLISKHFLKKKLVYVVKVIKLINQYYKNHDTFQSHLNPLTLNHSHNLQHILICNFYHLPYYINL